jgi:hypothetical protein
MGYARFDRLCRTVYEEVTPTWTSPIVPWDEILSEYSWFLESERSRTLEPRKLAMR